ncbi:MAG: diaminopropionate ammonia-lyase [bacterium]|nr:diaminopropionate ammonia-lyase [bacterium]
MTEIRYYHLNLAKNPAGVAGCHAAQVCVGGDALAFHEKVPGYAPTPLVQLPGLAAELDLASIHVKDEAHRFGTKAFKALGASYAVHRFLEENPGDHVFCTASDGNHGMAVAWSARLFDRKAEVFMPKGTVPARVRRIENLGARVTVVDGDYDAAVRAAARESKKHGWVLVQDTAWEGFSEIPTRIMAGYVTMFRELEDELFPPGGPVVDAVFLQAGVGSWAAAAVAYLAGRYGDRMPKIVCVEPTGADCCLASARAGRRVSLPGAETIMAGLNCGTPSLMAWPILAAGTDLFLALPDDCAREAMRAYYHSKKDDPRVVSGESGAAGLAALLALLRVPELEKPRRFLGLGETSRVLLFNTEGDTDPEGFSKIVGARATSPPETVPRLSR